MDKVFFDANIIELQNGIKLITIKRDTQIASLHCGIKMGSLFESPKEKGISHFIEHMLFKGTSHRDNEALNNDLEQRGGEYNAYTDYTTTVFSITALSEEMGKSIEILSDMLMNSIMPEEEVEKERGVILAEIRTSKDDVEDLSFKRVNEAAFKKSPLRYDTIGEEKTVKSFKREQLMSFYKKYYVPNNCYISMVSPYEHSQMKEMIEKYFGSWHSGELAHPKVICENNIPGKKISYKKDMEQCTIVYAYTFHNLNKKEELALKILNHKLGESANSILFRTLREERGLAYDVYSHLDLTNKVKLLYIYTAVGAENVVETEELINSCIEEVKNENITFDDGTVDLMKKVLKTAVASTLEDSTDLGNYVLHQCIDGESIFEYADDMENMEFIKSEQIYDIARKVLVNPTIHVMLPEVHS